MDRRQSRLHLTESAATPKEAFDLLLIAMKKNDSASMKALCSADSFRAFENSVPPDTDKSEWFAGVARTWGQMTWRWVVRESDSKTQHILLGPEIKETSLTFVRVSDGWILEDWKPGD